MSQLIHAVYAFVVVNPVTAMKTHDSYKHKHRGKGLQFAYLYLMIRVNRRERMPMVDLKWTTLGTAAGGRAVL